jgi:hypothetical protein
VPPVFSIEKSEDCASLCRLVLEEFHDFAHFFNGLEFLFNRQSFEILKLES